VNTTASPEPYLPYRMVIACFHAHIEKFYMQKIWNFWNLECHNSTFHNRKYSNKMCELNSSEKYFKEPVYGPNV